MLNYAPVINISAANTMTQAQVGNLLRDHGYFMASQLQKVMNANPSIPRSGTY